MRLLILSDLHLNCVENWKSWLMSILNHDDYDIVVAAGDLCSWEMIRSVMHVLDTCGKQVVHTPGNHLLYGMNAANAKAAYAELNRDYKNVDMLWNDVAFVNGRMFVGTPLWFMESEMTRSGENMLNDFKCIPGFKEHVYLWNAESIKWLDFIARENSIIVTHHLPSPNSICPRYVGDEFNCYFLCDMTKLIEERRPALWVHGHTHTACDHLVGKTRVVCNPLGIDGIDTNWSLNGYQRKIVEV